MIPSVNSSTRPRDLKYYARISLACCLALGLWVVGAGWRDARSASLRIELPEIIIQASWIEVERDAQLEAYFPSLVFAGSRISTEALCVRGEHFESLREVPVWGEFERGDETDRYIIGYEKAKIPRLKTRRRCVLETRDECHQWVDETTELPVSVNVDVFRSNARGGRVLAYSRPYTIPDCE